MSTERTTRRYADGQIIEYTSFGLSGYSVGQVVRYADQAEQDNTADLLVYIRARSGDRPFPVRESQLRAREPSSRPTPGARDDGVTVRAAGRQAPGTWHCPGCGTPYPEGDPDLIASHVSGCDYVDGSGQEYDVTLKWSVTHWYIGTVKSSALAAAAGARPLTDLAGAVLDPDDNDPDADLPTYLDDLAAGLSPETDGWEISHIYDARRDQPRA
jgi:hypothetical protein